MRVIKLFIILTTTLALMNCKKESDNISFLGKNPTIDGVLDTDLIDLKERDFNYIWQFDNPATDTVSVTYRMGYTPTHLYLYLETKTDSINYRPRGFVNGDGFKFLIATPQKDSITSEFYDMVFSASKDKNYWARKRIWDYNHNQGSNRAFGEKTKFIEKNNGETNGFEALIAWEDIPPYHPFFKDSIGYNLYFAKAIGDTITNGYAVVQDEGIWDEEIPKRRYKTLSFERPKAQNANTTVFQLEMKNVKEGSNLTLNIAGLSDIESTETYKIIINEEDSKVSETDFQIKSQKGYFKDSNSIATEKLGFGVYEIHILNSEDNTVFKDQFTILPNVDIAQIKSQVHENAMGVNDGAKHSLLFKLEQYNDIIRSLKNYESSPKALALFKEGYVEFNQFMNGIDPYKKKEEAYRRAFLSEQDNTLQPFSIKLPKNYNSKQKYPLMVFLHGSGATDVGLLNSARTGGEFIEIAPYGRDMFRAYASERSQKDIIEAINDVSKHFNVDREKIVIGGFSMGGYGSLRTFYENPDLYKGVVVHAGHPDLANYWLGGNNPNFLNPKYLEPFKGTKVFVYHGEKDGSLPVDKIRQMIDAMKKMNIDVTYSIVKENGHQYPDKNTNKKYFEWLRKL